MTNDPVKIEGLPQLRAKFSEFTSKMQRATLRDVLRSAAQPVKTDAANRAPRNRGQLAGDMAVSVKVNNTKAEALVGFKPRSWYGIFAELGTRYRSARPFLRPALDVQQDKVVSVIRDGLKRVIDRIALKAGI